MFSDAFCCKPFSTTSAGVVLRHYSLFGCMGCGVGINLLDPTTTGLLPTTEMPPQRTVSQLLSHVESTQATVHRLRRERNEARANVAALEKQCKHLKKTSKCEFLLCFNASSPIITRYYAS
jgi:hypothetical protein